MGVRRLSAASEAVLMKTRHTVLPPQHTSKDPLIETEASCTMCTVISNLRPWECASIYKLVTGAPPSRAVPERILDQCLCSALLGQVACIEAELELASQGSISYQ